MKMKPQEMRKVVMTKRIKGRAYTSKRLRVAGVHDSDMNITINEDTPMAKHTGLLNLNRTTSNKLCRSLFYRR